MHYGDDSVVGFEKYHDAKQFQEALQQRFVTFGLELHAEKTRVIEGGRLAQERRREHGRGKPETFTFLGVTHICGRSRTGRFQGVRRTMALR